MSIRVMTQVWQRARFAGGDLLVLLALADWANDEGCCWPSLVAIAAKARLSKRQVCRVLAKLCEEGVLSRIAGKGRGCRSEYLINLNGENLSSFRAVVSTTRRVTVTTKKGDLYDLPPNPLLGRTVIEPSIERRTPLPPLQASGVSEHDSVLKVMLACGWVNRRLKLMIAEAIALASKRGEPEGEAADRMIAAWMALQQANSEGLLKYAISPRKFIADAHWRTDAMWPWDLRKLDQANKAATGMFRGG
jgi:Helix-turn-helix domain